VPSGARTVLDLGCGAGDNASRLAARGTTVDGVTLSAAEAERARPFCRAVVVGDLETGLPPGLAPEYDAVIASHLLEHLANPRPLLDAVRGRLAPRAGTLVVALPNLLYCRYRFRLLRGRFDYEPTGIMDATHLRWYTFASGRALLEDHGFRVAAHAEGFVPLGLLRRVLPRFLTAAVDRVGVRFFPGLFGWQLLFVAQPR
jgi:SAM-dependent methyltransferase